MSLVTNWITKLPRLKNSKVARFSYKAEAYANDDIEGVENYDYSRDMNVPLATHTDFDPDMLSIGARTNFSSVPKNGLNHFFGRVSYNLNKVIDFLSDFLDDFISFTEIVSFSSSATLSSYADGSTKRLLNTAAANVTITLPVGETYLGSNTIALAPFIMLTITKRGTVWINSSGNAITADRWKTARNITISDADGTNTGTAVSVDGSENETLKLPSTIKATLSGNAGTATKLATARKINGVDFDGSANITVADSTKAPTSHASSATTYGVASESNYGHAKASTVAGSANGTASKGTTPTVFAQSNHVHPLQTSVSGNAGTATKWATAINLALTGSVTGNVYIDGGANVALNAQFPSDTANRIVANLGFARMYRFLASDKLNFIYARLSDTIPGSGANVCCIGQFGTKAVTRLERRSELMLDLIGNDDNLVHRILSNADDALGKQLLLFVIMC